MAFTLGAANLTALFMESIFYGLFLMTFFQTIYTLVFARDSFKRGNVRWTLVAVAVAMFVLGTLDVGLLFKHNLDAFVRFKGPGGADARFAQISDWVNPVRGFTFILQILLGDGMLIYRCYVVYGRSLLVIAFPCLLWLGTAVCGFALPIVEATFGGNAILTASKLNVWTDAGTVLTLVTNLFTTCLIAVRLYLVSKRSASVTSRTTNLSGGQPVRYAMRIIIESGVMYTLSTIVLAAVSYSENLSVYAVSDCVLQIIGISFNLIIVRVSTNTTMETQYTMQTMDNTATSRGRNYPLEFNTNPEGRPSETGFTASNGFSSTVVPSNASKERGIEFAHSDDIESQKGGESPEMWRTP